MRPIFADPKRDLVFKRIFGNQAHRQLLIQLLNDLLDLPEDRRIVDVEYLNPEQVPQSVRLKSSIVDVKCTDQRDTQYVVEMQVLNVEGFEKRLVFNGSKAFTGPLSRGELYPQLDDVVMVAICDFHLWYEEEKQPGATIVPMVSRWRMTEEQTGVRRLSQVRYAVMELPKYAAGKQPRTMVDKWAYFFRETKKLREIPKELPEQVFREALEVARMAGFTEEEWEEYDREGIAVQDARGALSLAVRLGKAEGYDAGRKDGQKDGRTEERRQALVDLCEVLGIELTEERRGHLSGLDMDGLAGFRDQLKRARAWPTA